MKGAIRRTRRLRQSGRFNSRTREGCDYNTIVSVKINNVSIHAPVKGAMYDNRHAWIFNAVSIHAPVKGAIGRLFDPDNPVKFQFTHP